MRYYVRVNTDFNWFSLQQGVFDTSLQKIANVIPTAAVKQSAKVLGPLVFVFLNTFSYSSLKSALNRSKPFLNFLLGGPDKSTVLHFWNFEIPIFNDFFKFTIVPYRETKTPQLYGKRATVERNWVKFGPQGWVFSVHGVLLILPWLRLFWGHSLHSDFRQACI